MNDLRLVVSFPKSGNTWFRAFLSSIRTGGGRVDINRLSCPNCASRALFDRYLGINSSSLTAQEIALLRPHVIDFAVQHDRSRDWTLKVHDAWAPSRYGAALPLPAERIAGILYIVRDPRDIALSLANHFMVTVQECVSLMRDADFTLGPRNPDQLPQRVGTWSMHLDSWTRSFPERIRVIRYEDMHSDPIATFGTGLAALGITSDPAAIAAALEASAFAELSRQERAASFVEWPNQKGMFFRRGLANLWRESLPDAQRAQIEKDHSEVMRRLGYLPAAQSADVAQAGVATDESGGVRPLAAERELERA
jgi:aryl sulfotransferase